MTNEDVEKASEEQDMDTLVEVHNQISKIVDGLMKVLSDHNPCTSIGMSAAAKFLSLVLVSTNDGDMKKALKEFDDQGVKVVRGWLTTKEPWFVDMRESQETAPKGIRLN